MDRAKKKLASAFRTGNAGPVKAELDIKESLSSSDFRLARVSLTNQLWVVSDQYCK